jgi:excisionase family DNA binding protein
MALNKRQHIPLQRLAYSINELADAAGCGRDKIYDAIRNGDLRAHKWGSRTIVPTEEARRFIASLPVLELGAN